MPSAIWETFGFPFVCAMIVVFFMASTKKKKPTLPNSAIEIGLNMVILSLGSLVAIFHNKLVNEGLKRHNGGDATNWAISIVVFDFALVAFAVNIEKWGEGSLTRKQAYNVIIVSFLSVLLPAIVLWFGYN